MPFRTTWLRWSAAPRDDVTEPRAYLARTVTNLALNRLRAAQARREAYVGPWLPEPLLTRTDTDITERAEGRRVGVGGHDGGARVADAEERAVFVLREVFGFGHAEIAAALGRSDAAVRQLAHRAREHVQARRPRFEVDQGQQRVVTARFPRRRRRRRHRRAAGGARARCDADRRRLAARRRPRSG